MRQDSDNVDVLSELIQPPRLSSLLFGMKSQHSTDSMFYSKQPLPRVFCALPPVSPTWCAKTVAMWTYCLYCFNHLDSLRCFFAWKVNIQLTLCFTPRSLFLASSVLFLQSCLHHTSRLWQCGCIVFIASTTQTLFAVIWHEKSTFNWLYVLLQAASSSRLLCSSSSFAYMVCQDCGNVDVLSLLLQSPRLSSLFFCMKSQHSTDSMFYYKQPLPRVFCALPPIVPTSCVKTLAMWMYCLYCFNHPDSLRCFLAWKVNIQLTLCFTPSGLFLASSVLFLQSCLHHAKGLWQCGCIVWIDSTTQTLFAVIWHEKSTFNWFYVLLQAASSSRLLCSSSNRAYIMRQDSGNVDVLSLLLQSPRLSSLLFGMKSQHSTDSMFYSSSLFLASSVLFLQSCLHHTSRLWQCGCIVFIASYVKTLFAVIWHEKSTFNWLYVLLQAASSSRLLCSSSNRAYIMRQDSGNVDVLSLLLQPPRLSSLFFGMKSQHSDSMFYSKQPLPRVFCALPPIVPTSCVKTLAMWMYCLYWFNHPDSFRCYLAWKVNIQLTLCFTLAASSSRLLCSSSNRAYIIRQDIGNVDVLSLLLQPPRLSSLLFGMKSQHSTDSMFYSKQPLPRVFCALPPIVPTSCVKTLAMWMYCLYWHTAQTLFAVFWHEKSTFNWLYVLL